MRNDMLNAPGIIVGGFDTHEGLALKILEIALDNGFYLFGDKKHNGPSPTDIYRIKLYNLSHYRFTKDGYNTINGGTYDTYHGSFVDYIHLALPDDLINILQWLQEERLN